MEREALPPDRVLVRASAVADRWSVPRAYVYRVAREGRLRSYRIGRHLRFDLADVIAFEQCSVDVPA